MRKIKIVSMLIIAMFMGLSVTSISGAEVLEADMNVLVEDWLGQVTPDVNVTTYEQGNDTVVLKCKVNESSVNETDWTYKVNDTLEITMNIEDQTNRLLGFFIFPRFVRWKVAFKEDPEDLLETPTHKDSGNAGVVRSLIGLFGLPNKAEEKIVIDMKAYPIDKDMYYSGETISMVITVYGFLPGDINGGLLNDDVPIFDKEIINLEMSFVDESTL